MTFGENNGASSLEEMRIRDNKYRSAQGRMERDPSIGCRLIQKPFFFEREQWITIPESFRFNTVQGKSYLHEDPDGAALFRAVEERLRQKEQAKSSPYNPTQAGLAESGNAYIHQQGSQRFGTPQTLLPRLGQGSFRIAVLDGFDRRCAVTGEKTLPILDAAHIRPWSAGGENRPGNGLLLRTDIHRMVAN